jgi:site-specific DNA-cytosine methylase
LKTVFLDLFAGIGGFALSAYWAGLRFDEHYFSEIDPYAVQVYQKRFPNSIPLGDIRKINKGNLPWNKENQGEPAQVVMTGGFP